LVASESTNTEPKKRRQVMKEIITYVGLDVHKESIVIALADSGGEEVREYGSIDGSLSALDSVIRKLHSRGKQRLEFVYEAGPCGYGVYRHLTAKRFDCMVVAPSKIPRAKGNRIKTDRRDAMQLARLLRSGDLTPIYVPKEEDEAIRDLSRAREDAKTAQTKARQRLNAFLLRHGFRYSGKKHWSGVHLRWISDITTEHPAQQLVLEEYIDTVRCCAERVERLTAQLREFVSHWRMAPMVDAVQALRGVSLITAATSIAELGDLRRFDRPDELMSFLGLVPSEHSSGDHVRRGSITKTGNGHVRRVLVEAAWAYRFPARVSRALLRRQEHLSREVCETAWKAQVRLCSRFRAMAARRKPSQVIVTAIARELSAFMWAIANQVPIH
jgi:transposase